MNRILAITRIAFALVIASFAARGATIFDVSSAIALATSTQAGRLSRNGLAQDWSGSEAFPGILNAATIYHYVTYSVNVGITPFVQIEMDSISTNTFISAYSTAYLPGSAGTPNFGFDTNWLGDAGSSGNYFGTDPIFFQVLAPINSNLVLVVNNTAAGNVGVGDPFHLTVEGYIDSSFTDPSTIPEPSGLILMSGGIIVMLLAAQRTASRRVRNSITS